MERVSKNLPHFPTLCHTRREDQRGNPETTEAGSLLFLVLDLELDIYVLIYMNLYIYINGGYQSNDMHHGRDHLDAPTQDVHVGPWPQGDEA